MDMHRLLNQPESQVLEPLREEVWSNYNNQGFLYEDARIMQPFQGDQNSTHGAVQTCGPPCPSNPVQGLQPTLASVATNGSGIGPSHQMARQGSQRGDPDVRYKPIRKKGTRTQRENLLVQAQLGDMRNRMSQTPSIVPTMEIARPVQQTPPPTFSGQNTQIPLALLHLPNDRCESWRRLESAINIASGVLEGRCQVTESSGPAIHQAWNILQDHFKQTQQSYLEVEMKRQRRELVLDVIGSCCSQLENAMGVGWREGSPGAGLAIEIMRSCVGELKNAAEMVKGI